MSTPTSLSLPEFSASEFVDKHNPRVLKRTITERLPDDDDWKGVDTIRVICRFRPANNREKAYSQKKGVPDRPPKYDTEQSIHLIRGISRNQTTSKQKAFKCTLDSILKPKTTQKQVFYLVGQTMILSCLEGFNSTIFAYGQSGSGKTYTMFGPENDTNNVDQFGLIPRCFIYLFQKLKKSLSQNGGGLQDFKVSMQLVQIYKRDLLDLLNPKSKAKLVIKTDFRNDSIFVHNLRSIQVNTVEEAFACLTEAQSNRIVAGHALNAVSSRSHMLVMVDIMQRSIDGSIKRSKLNFGDLAGSEDLTKALGKNPDPIRRQEAIAINSSLSALTTAISYLSKGKKPSYRDSPLTHILKDSLGGNSKTVMFVACSPHIYNRNETIRALRFAQTAKKVKNKAKKNEQQSAESLQKRIKELELNVASLQAQLVEARGKQHVMSRAMTRMNVGIGGRSTGLHVPGAGTGGAYPLSYKPGPIPGPYSQNYVSHTTDMLSDSVSYSMENMLKRAHSTADSHSHGDEWSGGSDEDMVVSDGGMDGMDELLKEDGGEEELNYIHEIGELRKQLQDAVESNQMFNAEIQSKNIELEQCNNKIAQLMEEADDARKELEKVNVGAARKLSFDHDVTVSMPGSDTSESDIDEGSELEYGHVPLPSMQSVVSGHRKVDSRFSFAGPGCGDSGGGNMMLQHLMELQHGIQTANAEMLDLHSSIMQDTRKHYNQMSSIRDSMSMHDIDGHNAQISESDESDADSDSVAMEEMDNALTWKLSKTKKKKSCFSFFTGGDSDSDEGNGDVTARLVEKYLQKHVKAELRKQSEYKKRKKKKRREKRWAQKGNMQNLNQFRDSKGNSYNFENDEMSVLTDSRTHSPEPENSGTFNILALPEASEENRNHNQQYLASEKNYHFYVDNLGDDNSNFVGKKLYVPSKAKAKTY